MYTVTVAGWEQRSFSKNPLTIDLVGSPPVGHVELLLPVEEAELHLPVALVGVRGPLGPRAGPLLGPEAGHEQRDREATPEERHEHQTAPENVHLRLASHDRLLLISRAAFPFSARCSPDCGSCSDPALGLRSRRSGNAPAAAPEKMRDCTVPAAGLAAFVGEVERQLCGGQLAGP